MEKKKKERVMEACGDDGGDGVCGERKGGGVSKAQSVSDSSEEEP